MSGQSYQVREVDWRSHGAALEALRKAVFCAEQGVPEALEIDGRDPDCVHVAAYAGGQLIGTARLLPSARVGRMAVAARWRRRGVGRALLEALLGEARRRGFTGISLAAQVEAVGFYQRCGFHTVSGVYMEAGIPHRDMRIDWGQVSADPETSL